eukprot:RCo041548
MGLCAILSLLRTELGRPTARREGRPRSPQWQAPERFPRRRQLRRRREDPSDGRSAQLASRFLGKLQYFRFSGEVEDKVTGLSSATGRRVYLSGIFCDPVEGELRRQQLVVLQRVWMHDLSRFLLSKSCEGGDPVPVANPARAKPKAADRRVLRRRGISTSCASTSPQFPPAAEVLGRE